VTASNPPGSSYSLDLALLRGAVEELQLGVATTRSGAIFYVNPAFERIYGAEPGALESQTVDTLFEGDTITAIRAELDAQRVYDGRVRARTLDGTPITLEIHVERYYSASGATGGFILARDAE
jgi:PAS domain S-box-containing protein